MREDVLTLEYQEVFGDVAVRIIYQNEEVLKRGEFEDRETKVVSNFEVDFKSFWSGNFFIRGTNRAYDNHVEIVSKKLAEELKEKVRLINEKYGIKKRWRAEDGEKYVGINIGKIGFYAEEDKDIAHPTDNALYENGLYVKTLEQGNRLVAELKRTVKEFWEQEEVENE